jgi:hypothetical protein
MRNGQAGVTTLMNTYSSSSSLSSLSRVSDLSRPRNTGSMTLSTILSILMESHEDSRTASLGRAFSTKTLNLAIRINRVIFQCRHFLPKAHLVFKVIVGSYFLCLCLIFFGVVYCFFFLFFAPPSRLNTN